MTDRAMELSVLVTACEESAGGEKETEALFQCCHAALRPGEEVNPAVVKTLANMARSETSRERMRGSDLLARLGAGLWSPEDHATAVEVRRESDGLNTLQPRYYSGLQTGGECVL